MFTRIIRKLYAPRVTADYDQRADVLYVVVGEPRPAVGEVRPGVIVLQFDDNNSPCGVTVIGYKRNEWPRKKVELVNIIAHHLSVRSRDVKVAIDRVTIYEKYPSFPS